MVVFHVSTFILHLHFAGGMLYAFKANVLAASQDAPNSPATAWLSQTAAKVSCFYAFVFLLLVNRSMNSLKLNCSAATSSCN